MTVGVVGLGLIGGSAAKAYSKNGDIVYGYDISRETISFAVLAGAIGGVLDTVTIKLCDLIIIAVCPADCISFLDKNSDKISNSALVIDFCGTKQTVCAAGFTAAQANGFTFIGGHPMAGTEHSGFKHSKANMFKDSVMVVVPPVFDDILLLERVKSALSPLEFKKISVTTAPEHDELIAFTSQIPHIISNAFIKSPTAKRHRGYSAGSYRDMTRVAWLNEHMWSELFLENSESVLRELDIFAAELAKYRCAIVEKDFESLKNLLAEGRLAKEEIDNKNN